MEFNIRQACERLQPYIVRTPLVENEYLSDLIGKRVFLKLESLQRTGAFKFRGALNYMLKLSPAVAERGVITSSSGNHGLGLALAGKMCSVSCSVVMPKDSSVAKQEKARSYGAEVILLGDCFDAAQEAAQQMAAEKGMTYVSGFNHPDIIEGQGSVIFEILADLPEADCIYLPVGGGGMLGGALVAKEELSAGCEVIGVEPEGADSMTRSLEAGALFTLRELATVADGVAVKTPGSLNFALAKQYAARMVRISDAELLNVQEALFKKSKLMMETAGAVAVAGLIRDAMHCQGDNLVAIVTGANLDFSTLKKFMA